MVEETRKIDPKWAEQGKKVEEEEGKYEGEKGAVFTCAQTIVWQSKHSASTLSLLDWLECSFLVQ